MGQIHIELLIKRLQHIQNSACNTDNTQDNQVCYRPITGFKCYLSLQTLKTAIQLPKLYHLIQ